MELCVYVDGSGGPDGGYGYFVKETGDSFYESGHTITNNQAEYLAIISALEKFTGSNYHITILSDSKNTVCQLNHEFAINNDELRKLAQQAWKLMAGFSELTIKWIPRQENIAGKMLGS